MNEINITENNYTIEINPTESYVLELNEQGPQGLRGFTGPQGPQGIQGIQGEQGIQGNDGFSPIATVSQEGNVTTITITDKEGTTTENIDLSDILGDISDINTLLATYGNIVTHNVSEFATSAQGTLADSALQSGDNVSELINNVGYITSASLPTDYVPETRTINGYALSSNITLSCTDVGALSASTTINDLTTTTQQNALNSGATTTNIGQITTNANSITDLQTNKQDVLTAGANIQINNNVISATDTTYTAGTGISIVNGVISNTQTSAEWGNIQGTLSNQTDLQTALDAKQNTISDLSTIRSGAALGATALQPNDNITELVNNAGYITGITSSDVINALGYTPYNTTNPNGYITASALTGYEQTLNKVTSISSSSTDTQYPSAKCVYDIVGDIETLLQGV